MTLTDIGFLISDICSLAPVVVGLYFFNRLGSDRKILLYFFAYGSLVELSNAWMAMHALHNTWSINLYELIEYSVFIFVFNKWSKEILVRWLSLIGSVI